MISECRVMQASVAVVVAGVHRCPRVQEQFYDWQVTLMRGDLQSRFASTTHVHHVTWHAIQKTLDGF